MHDDLTKHELLSAMADGQLGEKEFNSTVEWVDTAEGARLSWHAYHLLGDVLRYGESMVVVGELTFVERWKHRLEKEATVVQYGKSSDVARHAEEAPIAKLDLERLKYNSANESHFRWKVLVGVASLALVLFISWEKSGLSNNPFAAPRFVQVPVLSKTPGFALQQLPMDGGGEPQIMVRDAHLDALLAAHRQLGGASALEMPAGFLRNATLEGAVR